LDFIRTSYPACGGYITDFKGKKITAQNSIIIATSNAGSEYIRESIAQGIPSSDLSEKTMEFVLAKGIFSPEFINRFDSVIVFTPLSEGSLREVAKLKLLDLNKRLLSQNIQIDITPRLLTALANMGYHPEYGARTIQRTIIEVVENQVAKRLLEPDFKKGETIQISL
jgi:ATP-dependent Clp protease ATP-binding subunit ClpA